MRVNRLHHWCLTALGIGAAGSLAGTAGASSSAVFAKQFLDKGAPMAVPEMVYDPELQMMVDPVTGQPIYKNNTDMKLAKVTAGCGDCPKYDK